MDNQNYTYTPAVVDDPAAKKIKTFGTVALILVIASIALNVFSWICPFLSMIPVIGMLFTLLSFISLLSFPAVVAGLVFAILTMVKAKAWAAANGALDGPAKKGRTFALIALILAIVVIVIGIIMAIVSLVIGIVGGALFAIGGSSGIFDDLLRDISRMM